MTKRGTWLGIACLLAVVPTAALTLACGGGGGGREGSSGGEGDGYRGELTIENRSSHDICHIMIEQSGDGMVAEDVSLSAGGTTTVDLEGDPERMFLTECGGQNILFGHAMNFFGTAIGDAQYPGTWAHDRLVLFDEGSVEEGPYATEELSPRPVSQWIFFEESDASLSSEFHDILTSHASSAGWREEFEFTWAINDWNIVRNRRTGIIIERTRNGVGFARWPDGHCTAQVFGYVQAHDGSDFGATRFQGTSTQLPMPCAALDYASGNGGGGGGASSGGGSTGGGGGGCSNTCSSSGDGECDDGGPGSLYDVCALGTDCDDCGPR